MLAHYSCQALSCHCAEVSFVGRLTEQKDFPTLIRAVAALRQKRRVRLLVLGEGEDREDLVALAREEELVRFFEDD